MELLVVITLALVLDAWLGEVKRFHPLVGFGNGAKRIEKQFNQNQCSAVKQKLTGMFAWSVLVLPLPALYFFLQSELSWWWLDIAILYFAIGHKSLKQHALQVFKPLQQGDITTARHYCGYLVSRDTSKLESEDVSRAVVESVLENGHDAVIASLFWYCVGGAPLVIIHRLANTLDAMWGYKNSRFLNFGWFSAKADDLLGWPSAKVTAFLYALQSKQFIQSLSNAYYQSKHYKSLNGGWAMASGATALNVKLGGKAVYFEQEIESVTLGQGDTVQAKHICSSVNLVTRAAWLFVFITFAYTSVF